MTAIILAGGRGRRMKADKASLDIGGRTLLAHVLAQLEPYFEEILISVTPGQELPPVRLVRLPTRSPGSATALQPSGRIRVVKDEIPGQGPIGGLCAALKTASNEACAVVACDIPEIDIALLRSLARAVADAEVAVPVGPAGLPEPLFAVYRRSIIPAIGSLLGRGERSLLPLYRACRTALVRFDDPRRIRNLNTRRDYEDYLDSRPNEGAGRDRANRSVRRDAEPARKNGTGPRFRRPGRRQAPG
jgi:molybdopterin-guanine dinucleotide biosynthesis protein A